MKQDQYSILQSHCSTAHSYWRALIKPEDTLIDATCGNGQDTLILAKACPLGKIYAIDVLQHAIELTTKYLKENLPEEQMKRIVLINSCHSNFPESIEQASVKLIVYNLGYLPGFGNKKLTTMVETTIESLKKSLYLVQSGGAISLSLYPGHEEGQKEVEALINFTKRLDPKIWNVCHHQWVNRQKAPSLLFIQKSKN